MPKSFSLSLTIAALVLLSNVMAQQTPAATKPEAANAQTQATPSQNASGLTTEKDKFSYALGMNLGNNLFRQSVPVNVDLIVQGLKDAVAGGKTLLTDEQARDAMVEMQKQLREQAQEKAKVQGEANQKEGDAFLAANKSKEGVVTLPSGLQYKILKAGTGPKPTATDKVVCNYEGTLINGKEFDASARHGGPATFPVNGVIKGWTEALQLMAVGSKWQLFIPPSLAYGERGAGGDIGPNETLIFEVELVSIEKEGEKKPEEKK